MINLVLITAIAYRGIITFSRGGILTGLMMVALFLGLYFIRLKSNLKGRLIAYIGIIALGAIFTWGISSRSTDGLIDKRYANQDATGKEKSDVSTGRSSLFLFEFEAFKEQPILGVGVGKLKELRFEKEGVMAASVERVVFWVNMVVLNFNFIICFIVWSTIKYVLLLLLFCHE